MFNYLSNVVLVTAGYDVQIRFWDPSKETCIRSIGSTDSQVNCLAITTDKQHLSVGGNKVVKIYEVPSLNANPVMVFDGHEGNVTSVGFQNESKWMYTGSEDTTIRIWDLRAKGFQRLFEATSPINSMVLAQNQVDLYSADQNGVIRIWDLTKSACKQHIDALDESGIHSISLSMDGKWLAAGSITGICYVYTIEINGEFSLKQKIAAHEHYILKVLFSPDSKYLATCSSDHSAKLFKYTDTGFETYIILHGHSKWVWDCVFSCDSEYLVTVSSDTIGRVWNLSTGDIEKSLIGHSKGITCITMNDLEIV